MKEIWRPIVGYAGHEVSNLGRVRSLDRVITFRRIDGHSHEDIEINCALKGKILRPDISNRGYPRIMLKSKGHHLSVHKLVLEAFRGPCPEGHEACHANDIKADNRLSNLSWGTPSQNQHDAIRNGKSQVGELKPNAKLKNSQISEIRLKLENNGCIAHIARNYGVSESAIRNIKLGKSWRHTQ